jgi:hypothetical protein
VVLVIVGVALIFFEHGKRVAARAEQRQQSKSPFERVDQGAMGFELTQRNLPDQKEIEKEIKEEEPSTPLLYKKPKLAELDGVVTDKAKVMKSVEEERRKRILSVRSIYELA